MDTAIKISSLQPEDLAFAVRCAQSVGWMTETHRELEAFYAFDPEGFLIARLEDQPAGICSAISYGGSGFIGQLIVEQAFRGRGIGGRLFQAAVDYLKGLGDANIYLDGVLKAVTLYERHGFRKVCRSLRFSGQMQGRGSAHVRPMTSADLDHVCALDRQAFSADRGFFLRRRFSNYPNLCYVLTGGGEILGYVFGKPAPDDVFAGPWVALPGAPEPEALLYALAQEAPKGRLRLGVLANCAHATALAERLGLAAHPDSPWRMALGEGENLGVSPACYAVGSPAKG